MQTEAADLTKLDHDLTRIFRNPPFEPSESIPVVVRVCEDDRLERVCEWLQELGTIRHVLRPARAVSAWLPISTMGTISGWDAVCALELAQPENLA